MIKTFLSLVSLTNIYYKNHPKYSGHFLWKTSELDRKTQQEITKHLSIKKIIEKHPNWGVNTYRLTDLGLNIVDDGSVLAYSAYLGNVDKEERDKRELNQLNIEKLRYDTTNSKWKNRTYWFTFTFAVIALLISLYNFYISATT